MFAYAAFKLNRMRRRIQDGGGGGGDDARRRASVHYGRSISTAPLVSGEEETEMEAEGKAAAEATTDTLKKRFMRQISSISAGFSPAKQREKRRAKYKANREW